MLCTTLIISKYSFRLLEERVLTLSLNGNLNQVRERHFIKPRPKLRNPTWFTQKTITKRDELVSPENKEFISEVVQDKYSNIDNLSKNLVTDVEWTPKLSRTGVIARKIGVYPLWLNKGKKIQTTLLQVLDNHVIKYYTPEEYEPPRKRVGQIRNAKGCLLLGADRADPSDFTREYCGLFTESGVIPKKVLGRFFVSPNAALPLGTLITAMHFQVGNYVDVRGNTIDRGFQGVMKRHGFKGMPASHGVTKTHRRGGNIGGGGEKGRVWPGTKMPGHMGNRFRIAKGLKIYRINTKYNVLWVSGQAIPGEVNSIVYVYDTVLPLKKPQKAVPFPTYLDSTHQDLPEDIYDDEVHKFSESTILFNEK